MSISNLASIYSSEDKSQVSQYEVKKSFFMLQGFSEEKAISKAILSLKSDRNVCETHRDINSITVRDFLARISNPRLLLSVLFYSLIVILVSTLLLIASLDVFGYTWEGWFKAIALELGILSLAISKFEIRWIWQWTTLKDIFGWLLARGTLVFLLFLSFTVLHTGVENERANEVSSSISTNETLLQLTYERDNWQKIHDAYAPNRHTDKANALKEVSRLNSAIQKEKKSALSDIEIKVVNMNSQTETMFRAVLLLLNIIFGHKLASQLASIRWPPLKATGNHTVEQG